MEATEGGADPGDGPESLEEWFPRWVAWTQATLLVADWPPRQSGYWGELTRLFAQRRVTPAEATRAVRDMFAGVGSVTFAREFPAAFASRLGAIRREDDARRRLDAASPTRDDRPSSAVHQAYCEAVWAEMDGPSRESWRGLVRRRMPFLAAYPQALETMAMAWCAYPDEIPPERPARFEFPTLRPADHRRAAGYDRILDGPPPAPAPAPAPPPPEPPDESSPV